jgi:hypothetical protein
MHQHFWKAIRQSQTLLAGIIALFIVLAITGCASVKVSRSHAPQPPTRLPPVILVERFSFDGVDMRVDREGADLAAVQQELSDKLQKALVERLPEIAPTREAASSGNETGGWLIRGRFTRVYQGSRALRAAFGFGLGATKLETRVEVFDLARPGTPPWLVFCTTGGSNAEPGAISGVGPANLMTGVGIVSSGLTNAAHGLSEDTWRTSRVIRNFLVEELRRNGLLTPTATSGVPPLEKEWKAKKL